MAGSFSKEYEMTFALNAALQSGFTSSFGKASSSILEMQKQLQALAKNQSDISAYEKQQNAITQTESKLRLLQQQYDNIQKEIEETEGFSASLENQLLSKQAQIDKTSASLEKQTQKLDAMGSELKDAGVDTNNLTDESKRLEKEMEELKKDQEEAAKSAKSFGEQTTEALDAVSSAIAAAGIATAFKELAGAYKECLEVSGSFEASMSQVAATMGVTSSQVRDLGEFAKEMGATTSFSAIQSAEALNYMALAGYSSEDSMQMLPTVLNLAAAGSMDLASASDMVTDAQTALGLSFEETTVMVDQMAKASSKSNTSVMQLGEAFLTIGGTAKQLSGGTEELSTMLSVLADNGIKGAEAGTHLRNIMLAMTPTTKPAIAAWDELGMSAYDASGNLRELDDVFLELSERLSDYTDEDKTKILTDMFKTTDLASVNALLDTTKDRYEALYKEIGNAGGSASKMANTQLDNMNGQLTIMESALEGVEISMGELWQDEMTSLYKIAGELLSELNQFIKQNPGLVKSIIAGAGAFGSLATGVAGVSAAMKVAEVASGLFGATIGGLPIMAVVAGVSALTAGGVLLYDALTEDDRKVQELTSSSIALRETMASSQSAYDNTVENTEAVAKVADNYISKLEELEAAGLDTEEEQRQYHNTLALLCQTVPELADHINLETDEIEGGTASLRANTEAWKENAKAKAYQEQLTAVYAAQADVMIEAEKNSIKLTEAQYKLSDAQGKYDSEMAEYNRRMAEFRARIDNCSKSGERYADVAEEMHIYESQFNDSIIDTQTELWEAEEAVKICQRAIDDDAESVAEAQAQIDLMEQAVGNLTDATDDNTDASRENAQVESQMYAEINSTASAIDTLTGKYNEAYDAAFKSISGQYDLWEKVDGVTATSVGSMNEGIESQIKYWNDYKANLDVVSSKVSEFDGLGDVLASFADGSEESAAAVAGIADAISKGNTDDVNQMIANYKQLREEQKAVSESVADLQTEYTQQMEALTEDMASEVEKLNLSDEAKANGEETIKAYIEGIEYMAPQVANAYQTLYNKASEAIRNAPKLSLPTIQGYASGTNNAEPGIKLVGEEGPELVAFNGGEKVLNADKTKAALGGNTSNVAVSFNIEGNASDSIVSTLQQFGEEFAERVLEVINNAGSDASRRAYA